MRDLRSAHDSDGAHAVYTEAEKKEMIPEGSVVVLWPATNEWFIMGLSVYTYARTATARIRSWMLLKPRPLGRAPSDVVRDPQKKRTKGRPQTQRSGPRFGPTAVGKRKGSKKRARSAPSLAPKAKRPRK